MMNVWSPLFQNCIFRILIENVHTNNVIDYWGLLDLFLYTETFTFSFGHYCLDSWSVNMWPRFSSKWGQNRPADDDPRCHRLPSFNHGDLGQGIHEQFRVFPFFFNLGHLERFVSSLWIYVEHDSRIWERQLRTLEQELMRTKNTKTQDSP